MKILTWNINRSNNLYKWQLDELYDEKFDVICLQEVSESNLRLLENVFINYNIYVASEKINANSKILHNLFIVTMVTKDIDSNFSKFTINTKQPLQYKIIKRSIYIECGYVDLNYGNVDFRIFNSHLQCVTSPTERLNQLKSIFSQFNSKSKNIICGDLNTFSTPIISILIGWLFGYNHKDYLINEQKLLLSELRDINLSNPIIKGHSTILRLGQLDYIIHQNDIKIINSSILKKQSFGSDHFPVQVFFDI